MIHVYTCRCRHMCSACVQIRATSIPMIDIARTMELTPMFAHLLMVDVNAFDSLVPSGDSPGTG